MSNCGFCLPSLFFSVCVRKLLLYKYIPWFFLQSLFIVNKMAFPFQISILMAYLLSLFVLLVIVFESKKRFRPL